MQLAISWAQVHLFQAVQVNYIWEQYTVITLVE